MAYHPETGRNSPRVTRRVDDVGASLRDSPIDPSPGRYPNLNRQRRTRDPSSSLLDSRWSTSHKSTDGRLVGNPVGMAGSCFPRSPIRIRRPYQESEL